MESMITLITPFAGGLLLGLLFFGGLWLTVAKTARYRHPGWWFMGSLLLRTVLVIAGFYLIGGDQPERFAACLLGFVLVKITSAKMIGSAKPAPANENETT